MQMEGKILEKAFANKFYVDESGTVGTGAKK